MVKGFTVQKVYINRITGEMRKGKLIKHYTWSDEDMVYWWDETDDDMYCEVPQNAKLSFSLDPKEKARLLVRIDR